MRARSKRLAERLRALPVILIGAVMLRLAAGVGFANYDTLYALAWGGQLSRGSTPAYGVPIAPTPHPLVELIGLVLAPLGPRAALDVTVALGFIALSACGWVLYRLGAVWFGRGAGAVAALLFLTRVPVLSYGVRAYVDIPYVLLVLGALLVESRRRKAGAPVLALLGVAGLLRPEAWAFTGLYWLYVTGIGARLARPVTRRRSASAEYEAPSEPLPARAELVKLTAIAAGAPLLWVLSDLLITGHPFWSLTNTRHTATTLHRDTGIADVPEYIPRRIGEILRPAGLVAAACGGVLTLCWLRRRALLGARAGVTAVLVFALFASFGLPINTRYAFVAAAILCVFAGAAVFGWTVLPDGVGRRRPWAIGGALLLLALIIVMPAQIHSARHELATLKRQHHVEEDLLALVRRGAVNIRCGPVGVPNHAPIPLLSLFLKTSPANVISAEAQRKPIASGVFVDPASKQVEADYKLDARDPHKQVTIPPGFLESATNDSWLIFKKC